MLKLDELQEFSEMIMNYNKQELRCISMFLAMSMGRTTDTLYDQREDKNRLMDFMQNKINDLQRTEQYLRNQCDQKDQIIREYQKKLNSRNIKIVN